MKLRTLHMVSFAGAASALAIVVAIVLIMADAISTWDEVTSGDSPIEIQAVSSSGFMQVGA